MLPLEISSFIDSKRPCNFTKLQVIQDVIENFGCQFPNFSFTDWCKVISDYIDAPAKTISHHETPQSTKGAKNAPEVISSIRNTTNSGPYKLLFDNAYSIVKQDVVELFKATVLYIGPYFVESLKIKCGACSLISYVRTYYDKTVQYPIGPSCYLYIKFPADRIIQLLLDILSRLSITAELRKGKSIIFTSISTSTVAPVPIDIAKPVSLPELKSTGSSLTSIPENYQILISNVRRSKMSGVKAPHKPILLLTLIELIKRKLVSENKFYYNDRFNSVFSEMWHEYVQVGHFSCNSYSPFVSMSNDGFWHFHYKNSFPPSYKVPSSAWINKYVDYAFLDDKLFRLLQNESNRETLALFVINRFRLKHI